MKSNTFIIILNLLIILLLQIFIINNILIFNRIHPYLYMLSILMVPAGYNRNLVMVLAFAIGFIIDIFSFTYGMHAAASVLLAFVRYYALNFLHEFDEEDKKRLVGFKLLGSRVYLIYLLSLTFFHHLLLFIIEAGGMRDFHRTIFSVILSVIFSCFLMIIYELAILFKRSDLQ